MIAPYRALPAQIVPVHLYGTVTIDPSAVIAPGVLIQAEADAQITIGPGVCIGAGSILHAQGGPLDIGVGACLGRDVLVVGWGKIGNNACLGAACTVLQPQVEAGDIVPPAALWGDESRGAEAQIPGPPPASVVTPAPELPAPPAAPTVEMTVAIKTQNTVSGRAQFDRLKRALFPHSSSHEDSS